MIKRSVVSPFSISWENTGRKLAAAYMILNTLTTDALTLKSVKNQKAIVIDLKQFLKPYEKELLKGK